MNTNLIDELKKPEYQGKTDQQAADMVNAKTVTIRKRIINVDSRVASIERGKA